MKPLPSMKSIRSIGSMPSMALLLLLLALPARAQWLTQGLPLKAGWNAVYLHVDASHQTLPELLALQPGNPIEEVWMWAPPVSTVQFVTSPQEPVGTSQQWRFWNGVTGEGSLARLVGNAAYLVRVAAGSAPFQWNVKGRPVAPSYEWTTTGLNFLGFPTPEGPGPTWEALLEYAPDLRLQSDIFEYMGGDLGAGNPARLFGGRSKVPRGKAFWIRAGTRYNRFFAPYEITLSGKSGLAFGEGSSSVSFRIRNLTSTNFTLNLGMRASEAVPVGQDAIVGVPTLLLRGALNTTNLTYAFTNLPVGTPRSIALAAYGKPGSDVEVVLGLNRSAMTGSEGGQYAAILRMTDSLGLSQVDLPVSASVSATSGLWVGDVAVQRVENYLPAIDKLVNLAAPVAAGVVPQGTATIAQPSNVPKDYSLRLIVHNPDAGGNAVLLQRVFFGFDGASNAVLSTSASALDPSRIAQARRLSVTHLPWTQSNTGWAFDSRIGASTNLTVTVNVGFDDHASNPFLHTYHPDHDNLDPTFKQQLPQGMESFSIQRQITLRIEPPQGGLFDIASARQRVSGTYLERIRVQGLARAGGATDTREFVVSGTFNLNRVSKVASLTPPATP